MNENDRVQIKSIVKGTVVLTDPDLHFRREWTKKGQINTIPFGILQDLIYQPGVESMFTDGLLEIVDKKARVELGLEVEGVAPAKQIMTEAQMLGALVSGPDAVEKALDTLPEAQVEEFVQLAVEKEITDMAKVDIIKKKTGKDVIALVKFNRQLQEEPRSED